MQGKDLLRSPGGRKERITPACAGKNCPQRTLSPRPQDHPRACGKKRKIKCANTRRKGSPPRMRGKALRLHGRGWLAGITPACAGKSRSRSWTRCARRDHPRACGEKCIYRQYITACSGSPPPVRGKEKEHHRDVGFAGSPPPVRGKGFPCSPQAGQRRITPACAGKRGLDVVRTHWSQDHPRPCGEKAAESCLLSAFLGSPLPMQGKDLLRSPGGRKERITPAHAGKSCPQRTLSPRPQDHPRACGKKWKIKCANTRRKGSPPRVRGKGARRSLGVRHLRITPACAGKSRIAERVFALHKDHPRLCGEKGRGPLERVGCGGSPPPVRGKVSLGP